MFLHVLVLSIQSKINQSGKQNQYFWYFLLNNGRIVSWIKHTLVVTATQKVNTVQFSCKSKALYFCNSQNYLNSVIFFFSPWNNLHAAGIRNIVLFEWTIKEYGFCTMLCKCCIFCPYASGQIPLVADKCWSSHRGYEEKLEQSH